MKKYIQNIKGINNIKKNQLKILFSLALIFTLIIVVPISSIHAYAALLEDCDLDGYDDATGVPVPWPGYDETKGDTPSGPGGVSTSTKAATSTTTATTAATTATTVATTVASTNNTSTVNTSNTSSGSTNTSSSSNTNTTTAGSSNSTSAVSGSTGTASTGTASTVTASTSNTGAGESNAQSTVTNGNSDAVASYNVVSSAELLAPVSLDAIINTKGLIKIVDAKGSIIHAGSSIIISGSGFIGSIDGLEIEIHSDPLQLGTVTSSKDGSFEVQISIPKNLEAGTHNIVVLYQGKEITSQQIEVAPKAADTFLGALTVGLSADNKGLVPGLFVLAGLIIAGGVTLLIGGITNSRRSDRVFEKTA